MDGSIGATVLCSLIPCVAFTVTGKIFEESCWSFSQKQPTLLYSREPALARDLDQVISRGFFQPPQSCDFMVKFCCTLKIILILSSPPVLWISKGWQDLIHSHTSRPRLFFSCDIWQQWRNSLTVSVHVIFLAREGQCSAKYQEVLRKDLLNLGCQAIYYEKE